MMLCINIYHQSPVTRNIKFGIVGNSKLGRVEVGLQFLKI
jgi:hypothetical protein